MARISGLQTLVVIACALALLAGCSPRPGRPAPLPEAAARGAAISGSVFRDLDGDGARDLREQGEPGVKVSVYDAGSRLVATGITDLAGNYSLNAELDPAGIAAGQTYRVEFSGWAAPLRPGPQGVDSGTEMQFVAGGATDVNFGLFSPDQYSVRREPAAGPDAGATPGAGGSHPAPETESAVAYDGPFAGSVPAPDFPDGLEWLNTGRPLTYADLRGKVVLLEFWTFGCIACVELIPQLKGLEETYADELVIIGVHAAKYPHEGQTGNIRHFVQRHGIDYPVVNDSEYQIAGDYQASIWPTLVLVNPLGRYLGARSGPGASDQIEASIEELVAAFDRRALIDRTPLDLSPESEGLMESPLRFPSDVLADAARDRLFIADTGHNRIVVADLSGRVEAVIGSGDPGLLDGDYQAASFHHPQGVALAGEGTLYVADTENHALRRVDQVQKTVTTVASDGGQHQGAADSSAAATGATATGASASGLHYPWDVLYGEGLVHVAMAGRHQIWTYDPGRDVVQAFAGSGQEALTDGPLARAAFNQPSALASGGRVLYVADSEASAIRQIDLDPAGQVRTLVGQGFFVFGDVDGCDDEVRLQRPGGLDYQDGVLYIADSYNNKIKVMDPGTTEVRTLLGTGEAGWRDGAEPLFSEPGGLSAAGGRLYVADTNNHVVRVVDLKSRTASTLVLVDNQGLLAGRGTGGVPDGEVISLPPQTVASGPGEIRLDVRLPAGYKVNDLAPALFRWRSKGPVVELSPGGPEWTVVEPAFPLAFEAEFREGSGELTGEAVIYYCRTGAEARCFVEEARFMVPVTVTNRVASNGTVLVEHVVEVP